MILALTWVLLCFGPVLAAEPFTVVVEGLDGLPLENVQAALALPNGLVRDGRVEPTWARRFAHQAEARAVQALRPFGFYAAEVQTDLQEPAEGLYRLLVSVRAGEPVRIAALRLHLSGPGAQKSLLQVALADFPLAEGDPLRHDLYEEGKGHLLAEAIQLGYLDAQLTRHEVRVNRASLQAEIDLELATGPQFRFGPVDFQGAEDYPQQVLRRYLTFKPGRPFSEAELARTRVNLLDADRFQSVRVVAERPSEAGLTIPIRVELTPKPRHQLRPGIGYGTDTGPRVSLRHRNLNVLQRGHELNTDLLYAQNRESLVSHYMIPIADRLDSLLRFSAEYQRDILDAFDSRALAAEASLTRGLARNVRATVYVNLSREWFQIGEDEARATTLLMPGLRVGQRRWTFLSQGRAEKGYAWQVEIRGASKNLLSDVSLLQGLISGNTILPLAQGLQLILRAEGGVTAQDSFEDLPATIRFFAGGDQSVRGYAYKTLGPEDDQGEVVGGRYLAVASAEIDRRLGENWSLAVFYDSGNAFDDPGQFDPAQGAGLGVRRHTPIGPIKLDLARQLNNAGDYRVHVSVGFIW